MRADRLNGPLLAIFFTCLFVLKWEEKQSSRGEGRGAREGAGRWNKIWGGSMCGTDVDCVTRKGAQNKSLLSPVIFK